MKLLVVGVSYRTAGIPVLERLIVPMEQLPPLLDRLLAAEYVGEAVVVSTCNRVEVYSAVTAFHGGLSDVGAALAERAGCPVNELAPHLYVHYDADAVQHVFRVAAGLDSMVVGEAQILGQLREAYAVAAEHGAAGRLLHELIQQALRVGKRAHAETEIDRAGQSVVTAALRCGLDRIDEIANTPEPAQAAGARAELAGRSALVIGAGSMGGLTLATLRRGRADPLYVINRDTERAERLAAHYSATVVPFDGLRAVLSTVDIVVCATASPEPVLTTADLAPRAGHPILVVDLAIPRDVAPDVADVPGVVLVDLELLGEPATRATNVAGPEVRAAGELVAAEADAYVSWLRGSEVAPTVTALRARADDVIRTELHRLHQRRPDLSAEQRADVTQAVHRVVQRLLHLPTVRVRQLAAEPGGEAYALVLRELFDLDVPGQIDPIAAGAQLAINGDLTGRQPPQKVDRVMTLRLGTRPSALALAQSRLIATALGERTGRKVELVEIVTTGDRSSAPISQLGVGVFVSALRDALLAKKIDFAVHSYKDLPTAPALGLEIAAIPPREDPRDALVARDGLDLAQLPPGSRIGTGSIRRIAQLGALGRGWQCVPIRGNVDTRLRKVADGELDAVILARAGLSRLDRVAVVTEVLDPMLMLPAPAQGALAVECRADDVELVELLAALDDPPTRAAVAAERSLLADLGAGCSAPVAALAEVAEGDDGMEIYLRGGVFSPDGQFAVRLSRTGTLAEAVEVGRLLAADLRAEGADTVLGARI